MAGNLLLPSVALSSCEDTQATLATDAGIDAQEVP